jgi:hypothetical protein
MDEQIQSVREKADSERSNVSDQPCECRPAVGRTDHEWVVFSTALADRYLMVQCVECGLMGSIDDPSEEEWDEAFHAPSRRYRWRNDSRITLRGDDLLHVIRATEATRGEGVACCRQLQIGEYERFPAEFMAPLERMTELGRIELTELTDFVCQSDLCSRLFPLFIRGFQEWSGHRHSDAVNEAADRIEQIDLSGLHCSPGVVAEILRSFSSSS